MRHDFDLRMRAPMLAATLLVACMVGCADDRGDGAARTGNGARADAQGDPADERAATETPRPAPSGRMQVDQRFPAIPVEPMGHYESILKARAWTIVTLAPVACETCEEDLEAWLLQAKLWTTDRLRYVIIAEGRPDALEWLDAATLQESGVLAFSTTSSMFRFTGELNRPSFALVDTMGVVRFVARHSGTIQERWMSLGRNFRYQSAGEEKRHEVARRVFPTADRFEVQRTAAHESLGQDIMRLGISPWYATAYGADDRLLGHALPIERDTDCDTCDPLYLVVGMSRGHAIAIDEIEPVVSLGQREMTGAFFQALRGSGSDDDVAAVKQMLTSPKADRAVREILAIAFHVASRLESGGG